MHTDTQASTEQALSSFSFSGTVKIRGSDVGDLFGELFSNVQMIQLASREFRSYDECVVSARRLLDDYVEKINRENRFKLGSEINPIFSGKPTLSKDWSPGEVSRLWVYDRKMENAGQIHAVGRVRIFGSARATEVTVN